MRMKQLRKCLRDCNSRNKTTTIFERKVQQMFDYNAIAARRMNLPCKRFDLTDKVYFEYWGANEWEFTIRARNRMEHMALTRIVMELSRCLDTKKLTASRLPALMAVCKARLMDAA